VVCRRADTPHEVRLLYRGTGGPLLEARGRHFGHSHTIGNAIDTRLRWKSVALEQSMKVKRIGEGPAAPIACRQRQSGRKPTFPAARIFFETSRRCADDYGASRPATRATIAERACICGPLFCA
jgi:hypothetical protein